MTTNNETQRITPKIDAERTLYLDHRDNINPHDYSQPQSRELPIFPESLTEQEMKYLLGKD